MSGQELVLGVLLSNGVALKVGIMVAIAMVIGYSMYEQTSTKGIIVKIVAPLVTFMLFQIWIRLSIFETVNHPRLAEPMVIAFLISIFFVGELVSGMFMSRRVVLFRKSQAAKHKEIIRRIKENGNGGSPFDVKTEPNLK